MAPSALLKWYAERNLESLKRSLCSLDSESELPDLIGRISESENTSFTSSVVSCLLGKLSQVTPSCAFSCLEKFSSLIDNERAVNFSCCDALPILANTIRKGIRFKVGEKVVEAEAIVTAFIRSCCATEQWRDPVMLPMLAALRECCSPNCENQEAAVLEKSYQLLAQKRIIFELPEFAYQQLLMLRGTAERSRQFVHHLLDHISHMAGDCTPAQEFGFYSGIGTVLLHITYAIRNGQISAAGVKDFLRKKPQLSNVFYFCFSLTVDAAKLTESSDLGEMSEFLRNSILSEVVKSDRFGEFPLLPPDFKQRQFVSLDEMNATLLKLCDLTKFGWDCLVSPILRLFYSLRSEISFLCSDAFNLLYQAHPFYRTELCNLFLDGSCILWKSFFAAATADSSVLLRRVSLVSNFFSLSSPDWWVSQDCTSAMSLIFSDQSGISIMKAFHSFAKETFQQFPTAHQSIQMIGLFAYCECLLTAADSDLENILQLFDEHSLWLFLQIALYRPTKKFSDAVLRYCSLFVQADSKHVLLIPLEEPCRVAKLLLADIHIQSGNPDTKGIAHLVYRYIANSTEAFLGLDSASDECRSRVDALISVAECLFFANEHHATLYEELNRQLVRQNLMSKILQLLKWRKEKFRTRYLSFLPLRFLYDLDYNSSWQYDSYLSRIQMASLQELVAFLNFINDFPSRFEKDAEEFVAAALSRLGVLLQQGAKDAVAAFKRDYSDLCNHLATKYFRSHRVALSLLRLLPFLSFSCVQDVAIANDRATCALVLANDARALNLRSAFKIAEDIHRVLRPISDDFTIKEEKSFDWMYAPHCKWLLSLLWEHFAASLNCLSWFIRNSSFDFLPIVPISDRFTEIADCIHLLVSCSLESEQFVTAFNSLSLYYRTFLLFLRRLLRGLQSETPPLTELVRCCMHHLPKAVYLFIPYCQRSESENPNFTELGASGKAKKGKPTIYKGKPSFSKHIPNLIYQMECCEKEILQLASRFSVYSTLPKYVAKATARDFKIRREEVPFSPEASPEPAIEDKTLAMETEDD